MKCVLFFVLLFVALGSISAQLCTGSLGDPVMHEDFGAGANPGPQLPAAQTTLNYSRSSCPAPGEYSLVNLSFSCFANSWHTLSGDHTPDDAGGFYMLINAQSSPGYFFKRVVKDLCPGTTYEFATWIKNVMRSTACDNNASRPNLTFTVETITGTVLASYVTGEIPPESDPQWKQTGLLFKAPANSTEVVLTISNSGASGCGNALALDDVTLRPCGPMVNAVLSTGGNSIEVCDGDNQSFTLNVEYGGGFSAPAFQWQVQHNTPFWADIPGATMRTYKRPHTGNGSYAYRVLIAEAGSYAAPQCRIASNPVFVNVMRAPFVQSVNYIYGCLKGDVKLFASGANSYVWQGPNGFTSTNQSPILQDVKYSDAGLYKVIGTTTLGCKNADSTLLQVYPNATATSSNGLNICEGTGTRLQAGGGVAYDWFPTTGLSSYSVADPIASPTENTRYRVKVTNQYGCADTAYINVNVFKKPVADAGPDLKTRLGFPIRLRGNAAGSDVSWYWTPAFDLSSAQTLTPVTNAAQTTTYTLHVASPHGCGTSRDDVTVRVFEKILIPNAFSPNGDGINDTWYIEPLSLFEESITEVYNRNGQLVYRTKGYDVPWNGTRNGSPVPAGTYYYVIDLRVNREPKITGSVTILR